MTQRSRQLDDVPIRIRFTHAPRLQGRPFIDIYQYSRLVEWVQKQENPSGQLKLIKQYLTGTFYGYPLAPAGSNGSPFKTTCERCGTTIHEQFLECSCDWTEHGKGPRVWTLCHCGGGFEAPWQSCPHSCRSVPHKLTGKWDDWWEAAN